MTTPAQQFAAYIADGELRLPYRKGMDAAIQIGTLDAYAPEDIVWKRASGDGVVSALAVYHRKYDEDFAPPYNVAIVTLREGPFILSTVLDDKIAPHIGMTVVAEFDEGGRLVFAPKAGEA
ncbi:MAG: OB-fold domain-containing protein [Rhodospirillaceae bacterium]|nr:OB-fold domain-containing protein [Rhodospirillaceae bacterium]MDD9918736.1 OB-fold domain-containing protein [Rhodospirillaceae bacterium]MDD9930162.1 OB-fold domain-containing protein [Rhodospirillaceae bacterium]